MTTPVKFLDPGSRMVAGGCRRKGGLGFVGLEFPFEKMKKFRMRVMTAQ